MTPPRSLLICATPRSGSTLLCTMLGQTGQVGCPNSWFRRQNRDEWAEEWGLVPEAPFADYLAAAIRTGQSANGYFALRLMADTLPELLHDLAALYGPGTDTALLTRAFGDLRFLRLIRQDQVAQAVSRHRAEMSGLWHRNADGSIRELTGAAPLPVVYDPAAIAGHLSEIEAMNAAWDRWFTTTGVTPFILRYEALAADPAGAMHEVFGWLGIDVPQMPHPGTARLGDAQSADWTARFRAETGGI